METKTEDQGPRIHELKIWPKFFEDVAFNRRPLEVRKNDRDYQVGDFLQLREFDPGTEEYTGKQVYKQVIHVFSFDDLDADILATLNMAARPAALSNLVFLSLSPPPVSFTSQSILRDMRARTLHTETLGDPHFESTINRPLVANVYQVEVDKTSKDQDALLMTHLIASNEFHPAWTQWLCMLIHQRPIDGIAPPVKAYEEAEYDLIVYAIDPDTPITSTTIRFGEFKMLESVDSSVQFHGVTDDQAIGIQQRMMQLTANGQISPDVDYRRAWTQAVNNMIDDIRKAH